MPAKVAGRCLVTGVAGFIGSHLAERLVADGCDVLGVDCFTDYYDPALKRANIAALQGHRRFELATIDLASGDVAPPLDGVEYLFHQAGQPGVRQSWGKSFAPYVERNILATQRLLEAARDAKSLRRFVNASSSSIYGDAAELPVSESALPHPVSPYGVTKLAAEHLATMYANLGVPAVSLRYFTVYGARQRPDMAFNTFIRAMLEGRDLRINGDGEQTRDFTYVADVVEANIAAAAAARERVAGRVYNIGGGARVTLNHAIATLEELTGRKASVVRGPSQPGDARNTYADTSAARADLDFSPAWKLRDGLRAEVDWLAAGVG